MKVWITKYALTKGIYAMDARGSHSDGMVICEDDHRTQFLHGNEWHKTKSSAIARAEEMQTKKLASLKKQLKKIEKLTFE